MAVHVPGDLAWLNKLHVGSEPRVRCLVSTPYDYWAVAMQRARVSDFGGDLVACDAFVWSCSPGAHPSATRLGGIPFLPASVAWPTRGGVIGEFYAQLNFMDSRDIVPDLPGDVLLVFRYFVEGITSWEREMYEFVWVDLRVGDRVWMVEDLPSGGVGASRALHGHRFRDVDCPDLVRVAPDVCSEGLHVLPATKIGGVPSDRQSIFPPRVPADWRFIGQVASTWPVSGVPYPVYGHPNPVQTGDPEFEAFTVGPGSGILCLFLDGRGCVQMHFSDS